MPEGLHAWRELFVVELTADTLRGLVQTSIIISPRSNGAGCSDRVINGGLCCCASVQFRYQPNLAMLTILLFRPGSWPGQLCLPSGSYGCRLGLDAGGRLWVFSISSAGCSSSRAPCTV